jgi:hypothetical protein
MMKQHGNGCRSVTDSLARLLGALVVTIFAATAGTAGIGCGGSSNDSREGAGTATTGTGGGNATAGGQGGGGGGQTGTGAATGTTDPGATPGSTLFARQYGDEGQQTVNDLAVDDAGNTYVVGSEATPPALDTVFVLQYDATGELRWRQPFVPDGDSNAAVRAIVFQPTTGAVILAGFVAGTMTVGGQKVSSTPDPVNGGVVPNLWLTALDKAGYVVWTRVFSSPAAVFPDQVFVTGSGDIEVIGTGRDNLTVGGGPLCCEGSDLGITTFMARYSPMGEHLWSTATGGRFFAAGADTDAAGGMVIGGSISGTATFDGETFVSGGATPDRQFVNNGMVLRLDPDGHKVWNEILPATSQVFPAARLDRAGNIVLFGTFQNEVDLGNGQHLSFTPPLSYLQAGFLAKLAPDGAAEWAHALPPVDNAFVATGDLAVDATGNLVLTGIVTGGGVSLAGVAGRADAGTGDFIAKYAADGTYLWSRGFAVEWGAQDLPVPVAVDPSGNVSAAGNFDNTVDFGTGPLTAPGVLTLPGRGAPAPHIPDDVFVVKLAP